MDTIAIDSRLRENLIPFAELICGCFLYSLSVSVFYSPAKLLAGGVTGFAQILHFQFGLPVSLMVIAMNIPLFVLALLLIDKKFTALSLVGMLLLSGFLEVTSRWSVPFEENLTAVIVGGVLNGLGLGLVFRSEASLGGTDILSKVIQKYYAGNMAYTGLMINITVVAASALIYGLDQAVLTICAMFVSSQVNSYIIDGVDHRRAVSVITKKPDVVSKALMDALHRGATVLRGYGAYTGEEHNMVYCVISRKELAKLKRAVKESDPEAFLTITRLTGVYGHGKGFHSISKSIK